jgi:hypothetical protein
MGLVAGMLDDLARNSRATILYPIAAMEGGGGARPGIGPAIGRPLKRRSCLGAVGGPHAIVEVYAAIRDVMQWWP